MTSVDLIRKLKTDGWTLRNAKGSHHVFAHPTKPGHLSVPHPKKPLGLVRRILKDAGLL